MMEYELNFFVLLYNFVIFQNCVAFVIDRDGTVISYDINSISKCRTGEESIGSLVGMSLADCVQECGLREHCGSLSYSRQIKMCDLFIDRSKENLTSGNCIFISKIDIKVEKTPCGDCDYGQACDVRTKTCQVKECTSAKISNGIVIGNKKNLNSRIWYRCNVGYSDENTKFATCHVNGSSATAICIKISCGDSEIANGTITPENGTRYQDTATVHCTSGYNPSVNTVKCTASGTWDSATCERISCGHPSDLPPGNVITVYGTLYLDTAKVACQTSGNELTITCASSGKWVSLTCDPQGCFTTKKLLIYAGNVRTTLSGLVCRRWKKHSTFTKNHWGVELQYLPESSFEEAENFCRNPTTLDIKNWCFTSPLDTFEWCDIPVC